MMVVYRTILAGFVALAVAFAPVGAALASNQAAAKAAAMQDCHGKATQDCPSCDTSKANCQGDACGAKCCKLVGMITAMPVLTASIFVVPPEVNPQKPPDWQLRPRPPPPRS